MKTISVLAAKRLGITCCVGDTTLKQATDMMCEEDISSVVIVDEDGYLEGILSRTDILRAALADAERWRDARCADWMTTEVVTVNPVAPLQEAAELLQSKHIHRVVVAEPDEGRLRPMAVISDSDVVYHLVNNSA